MSGLDKIIENFMTEISTELGHRRHIVEMKLNPKTFDSLILDLSHKERGVVRTTRRCPLRCGINFYGVFIYKDKNVIESPKSEMFKSEDFSNE